jgi:hypothetical protein
VRIGQIGADRSAERTTFVTGGGRTNRLEQWPVVLLSSYLFSE